MGINTFLLDRRNAVLAVGGSRQTAGILRRFFKLTELDAERGAERDAAAAIQPSPVAAILMDITDLPLAVKPELPLAAHLVLGWEEGRGSVTDFSWDYLPQLGYALRDPLTAEYSLYEERSGLLHSINRTRASELALLDEHDGLISHGQPLIEKCLSVKPFIKGYAEADCTLAGGRQEKLLIGIEGDVLPETAWLIGKKPGQVERFPPSLLSGTALFQT